MKYVLTLVLKKCSINTFVIGLKYIKHIRVPTRPRLTSCTLCCTSSIFCCCCCSIRSFRPICCYCDRKMDDISRHIRLCIQQVHWSVNNRRRYLVFTEQFVPFAQLVFELCLRTDISAWCMSAILLSRKICIHAGSNIYRVKRKSSLVSHFPLPADPWPCCTSVVPALAAAQHPPALPGAAAEHPNEREGGDQRNVQRRPEYRYTASTCLVYCIRPDPNFIIFTKQWKIHIVLCVIETADSSAWDGTKVAVDWITSFNPFYSHTKDGN